MASNSNRASVQIKIDDKDAPQSLMESILQVVVEESLHQPGMFMLVLKNSYQPGNESDRQWENFNLLKIGKSITIGFGSSTSESADYRKEEKDDSLFKGEITAIETHFTEQTQAPIIVRGYDRSHRLHRGLYNRSFQNITDSDIVRRIAGEVGLKVGKLEDSRILHDYVFQSNQTNMEFLRQRAARLGFELFVRDDKIYFRKPRAEDAITLKWLTDLRSFRVRQTSAEQVKQVEVRAWDYGSKRPIIATAQTEKVMTSTQQPKGSASSTAFKTLPTPQLVVVDQPVFQPKEADAIAQSHCDQLGGRFVHADARAEGSPKIRPGRVVQLEELGPYSGKYYITETRHTFVERVYTTEFSVRGLRSGSLLETLSPQPSLSPGQTFLVGIVTDNEDPKGWGRVKVKFPTLTEEHASNWARVVSIGAGDGRGFDCLPEIDDEVLVAFEHGDIHRPYVLGNVWNGKDAPPNSPGKNVQDGKVRLRTFKTRTGHQIQFVEEDNGTKAGVYIETKAGHKFKLNDSDKTVEIETSGGHKVQMNDVSRSIQVNSTGNIQISAMGSMKLDAKTTIDITTPGIVSIKGSMIKLN